MKKIILTAAIALGTLTAMNAQTEKKVAVNAETTLTQETQDTYKSIKKTEVPAAVKEAMAKDFAGATLDKAYVNSDKEFKLEMSSADGKKVVAYATADGEWIEK